MGLIGSYNLRSMVVRKATAAMTAGGIAMVVAVFVMTLAIAQGFRATLVASGSPQNAIVLRKGATAETTSGVLRSDVPLVETLPQVARGADNRPLASPELVVAIAVPRISDNQPANVPARGVGPRAFEVRDSLKIIEGRRFAPGTREINVGRLAVGRFKGLTLGSEVKFAAATWTVVGIFAAEDASFESEIWGDVDLMMPAFQRNGYQSITVKLADPSMFDSFKATVEGDPRMYLQPQREQDYYTAQSQVMTTVIRVFGTFVTLILSIGAMFGAMNTMYAAVAYRTREIGTLRALGFSRLKIVTAFLAESTALAVIGGLIGCVLALPVHGLSTGTTNFSSFSEVAFKFRITPGLLVAGVVFSAFMGALGGLLPALRAARIPVARALREI
ncbi:MAG TPA: ABC transporter permease [Vicinamibacterales bacterium]|jgi:ABC-type lipoprotein release transport system permease subunit|nr:ABC transporter permease [Vicinamibacterales bacterium]